MTREQYLYLLLISGMGWFNWHDLPYHVYEFEQWRREGMVTQDKSNPSQWKLTDLAREVLGRKHHEA